MKKHYCIFLFFLCLIITSCENIVFEEETSATQVTTRSTYEDLGYYGSNFLEQTYSAEEAFGYLQFNPVGVEYTFALATIVDQNDIKSIVSVTGGNIIYNGHDMGSQIHGTSGMIRFTIKFTSTMAKVTLTLKGATPDGKKRSAKLSIDQRTYNGKYLPLQTGDSVNLDLVLGRLP